MKHIDRDLGVYILGGTGTCDEHEGLDAEGNPIVEKIPRSDKIRLMVENDVDKTELLAFDTIEYVEHPELATNPRRTDSSQYREENLMQISATMRDLLKSGDRDWFVKVGSDNAAATLHTIAESVPPSLLGDRIIFGLASQTHASPNRPLGHETKPFYTYEDHEPVALFEDAMNLLRKHRAALAGRIVMCCRCQGETEDMPPHMKIYAPRGLQKANTVLNPFQCRFGTLGWGSKKDGWELKDTSDRPEFLPRGTDDDFLLLRGVEEMNLAVASSYANVRNAIYGMINGRTLPDGSVEKGGLTGLVLTAPGDASLLDVDDELQALSEGIEFAAQNGVPVGLGAGPLHSAQADLGERKHYTGSFATIRQKLDKFAEGRTSLIDGFPFTDDELYLLICASVARARIQKNLQGEGISEYSTEYIRQYRNFLREH